MALLIRDYEQRRYSTPPGPALDDAVPSSPQLASSAGALNPTPFTLAVAYKPAPSFHAGSISNASRPGVGSEDQRTRQAAALAAKRNAASLVALRASPVKLRAERSLQEAQAALAIQTKEEAERMAQ